MRRWESRSRSVGEYCLRNIGKCSPNDIALHLRRLKPTFQKFMSKFLYAEDT